MKFADVLNRAHDGTTASDQTAWNRVEHADLIARFLHLKPKRAQQQLDTNPAPLGSEAFDDPKLLVDRLRMMHNYLKGSFSESEFDALERDAPHSPMHTGIMTIPVPVWCEETVAVTFLNHVMMIGLMHGPVTLHGEEFPKIQNLAEALTVRSPNNHPGRSLTWQAVDICQGVGRSVSSESEDGAYDFPHVEVLAILALHTRYGPEINGTSERPILTTPGYCVDGDTPQSLYVCVGKHGSTIMPWADERIQEGVGVPYYPRTYQQKATLPP